MHKQQMQGPLAEWVLIAYTAIFGVFGKYGTDGWTRPPTEMLAASKKGIGKIAEANGKQIHELILT